MSDDNKRKETYQPQYLYIEEYKINPKDFKGKEDKSDKDDEDRGVIIIDIL